MQQHERPAAAEDLLAVRAGASRPGRDPLPALPRGAGGTAPARPGVVYRVTMVPDHADWAADDLRWVGCFHLGLWQETTDPAEAARIAGDAGALGWYVAVDPPLPAVA